LEGQRELQVSGALQQASVDDTDRTMLTGQVVANHFLSDTLSVGVNVRLSVTSQDSDWGDSTDSRLYLLGRGDYYLNLSSQGDLLPYVGAQAGIIRYAWEDDHDDDSEVTIAYGVHGGVKVFLSENISANLEGDLSFYSQEVGEDDETVVVKSIFAGLSYYL